jgi:hypothetical protein
MFILTAIDFCNAEKLATKGIMCEFYCMQLLIVEPSKKAIALK